MNAALLLLTSAMMAGADTPAQTPAQTAKPPVAAAPVYSVGTGGCASGGCSGCGTCDSCVLRAKGFRDAGIADPALLR